MGAKIDDARAAGRDKQKATAKWVDLHGKTGKVAVPNGLSGSAEWKSGAAKLKSGAAKLKSG